LNGNAICACAVGDIALPQAETPATPSQETSARTGIFDKTVMQAACLSPAFSARAAFSKAFLAIAGFSAAANATAVMDKTRRLTLSVLTED
jgi:hypothetical protein